MLLNPSYESMSSVLISGMWQKGNQPQLQVGI